MVWAGALRGRLALGLSITPEASAGAGPTKPASSEAEFSGPGGTRIASPGWLRLSRSLDGDARLAAPVWHSAYLKAVLESCKLRSDGRHTFEQFCEPYNPNFYMKQQ